MRKKAMVKILLMLLVTALVALTGCGGSDAKPAEEAAEAEESAEAAEPEEPAEEPETEEPAEEAEEAEADTGDAERGYQFVFTTTDTEGNEVTSEELFGAHAYTAINFWASWCPPCVGELPELAEMAGRFNDKDCAIVGVLLDGNEEQGLADGKDLMADAGVEYQNLLPWPEVGSLGITAVPTTVFVDREGYLVGNPVIGAVPEQYEQTIDALLAGEL